jgi:hypothetical protein
LVGSWRLKELTNSERQAYVSAAGQYFGFERRQME